MRREPPMPGLLRPTTVGVLVLAASLGLVIVADGPLEPGAVVGAVGLVIAAALLSLTALVAMWRTGSPGWVVTDMDDDAVASAFDDPTLEQPLDDAAAV